MRTMMGIFLSILFLAVSSVLAGKLTENLPPNAPLRIGVIARAESCTRKSQSGDRLSMHYTGTLVDGTEFDSSIGRSPFEFVLGKGQVIKGWDQGLVNMCVGEKRRLTIPSNLGYGSSGSGKIPGGATLLFDVELLNIEGSTGGSDEL